MFGSAKLRGWPLVVLGVAGIIMLSKLLIEDVLGLTWNGALRQLSQPGPASAAVIVGLLSIDLLVPVPSSLVMIVSGAIFGVLAGGFLSVAGSLLGNYMGFEAARIYGRKATERVIGDGQLERMQRVFARYGALAIVASRPLPVVMETVSVAAGLSNMRRSTFLLASLAGTVPIAFVYAYAGATSMTAGTVVPAAVTLVAIIAAGWAVARPLRLY